jgi:UDPglucose--hexose-1-phosphate uridylyltransferase
MPFTHIPAPTPVWEERWHPLLEEWVIIAAHRQTRPWIGATASSAQTPLPAYVPDCYLCPGNVRVSGQRNPAYTRPFVFDNDHPCAGPEAPQHLPAPTPPYRNRPATGLARVICYTPRHDLTLAEMPTADIAEVVGVWQAQTHDLYQRSDIEQVIIFENKGEVVGVSNPHPHGQVYATNFAWKLPEREWHAQRRYRAETRRNLFADILAAEQKDGTRIVYEDEHTLAFVPYFARYAYEVYVAPKRTVPQVYHLTEAEVESLAQALKNVTVRYDNLWQMSFPYVMALRQAPKAVQDDYHFFIGFQPPLRRPHVAKFLAGAEIGGGNFLSDTSPEAKAAELRALSAVHYDQPPNP